MTRHPDASAREPGGAGVHQTLGPPVKTEGTTTEELLTFWIAGRCAMTIYASFVYTAFQNFPFQGTIGAAMMPGSEKVWSRETQETAVCNKSFCRHATEYPDGLVVNHAPFGQSFLDGAVNGQVERSKQLAAYTYLTWLMNDGNMLEAFVNPPSSPNFLVGSMVRPTLLVPSVWMPYGWSDPGLSLYCATQTANTEHSNANVGLRLHTALEYFYVTREILTVFLRDEGEFEDLDDDAGAVAASVSITTALQDVTRRGDRNALIGIYQKSLNIHVSKQAETTARRGEVFPPWAVYAVVGMLSIAACIFFFVFACWLTSTVRQRRRLRAKQQSTWEEILDDAEAYSTSLGCPMALVSTMDFLDLERLVKFEDLREQGRLRVLDTIDKVLEFRKKFLVMYVSHQWCAWSVPDPNGVHYRTICAAVRTFAQVAHVSVGRSLLVGGLLLHTAGPLPHRHFQSHHFCQHPPRAPGALVSTPVCFVQTYSPASQEHLATRELFLAAVPLYVSVCDVFIVIAPPTTYFDVRMGLTTHLREGHVVEK